MRIASMSGLPDVDIKDTVIGVGKSAIGFTQFGWLKLLSGLRIGKNNACVFDREEYNLFHKLNLFELFL